MSTKQLAAFVASLLACMAGAATLHSVLVVPAILNRVGAVIDREIAAHSLHPHSGGVSRQEVVMIMDRMDSLATSADVKYLAERISDMNARLGRLEEH